LLHHVMSVFLSPSIVLAVSVLHSPRRELVQSRLFSQFAPLVAAAPAPAEAHPRGLHYDNKSGSRRSSRLALPHSSTWSASRQASVPTDLDNDEDIDSPNSTQTSHFQSNGGQSNQYPPSSAKRKIMDAAINKKGQIRNKNWQLTLLESISYSDEDGSGDDQPKKKKKRGKPVSADEEYKYTGDSVHDESINDTDSESDHTSSKGWITKRAARGNDESKAVSGSQEPETDDPDLAQALKNSMEEEPLCPLAPFLDSSSHRHPHNDIQRHEQARGFDYSANIFTNSSSYTSSSPGAVTTLPPPPPSAAASSSASRIPGNVHRRKSTNSTPSSASSSGPMHTMTAVFSSGTQKLFGSGSKVADVMEEGKHEVQDLVSDEEEDEGAGNQGKRMSLAPLSAGNMNARAGRGAIREGVMREACGHAAQSRISIPIPITSAPEMGFKDNRDLPSGLRPTSSWCRSDAHCAGIDSSMPRLSNQHTRSSRGSPGHEDDLDSSPLMQDTERDSEIERDFQAQVNIGACVEESITYNSDSETYHDPNEGASLLLAVPAASEGRAVRTSSSTAVHDSSSSSSQQEEAGSSGSSSSSGPAGSNMSPGAGAESGSLGSHREQQVALSQNSDSGDGGTDSSHTCAYDLIDLT
jgi:hypothetical protein